MRRYVVTGQDVQLNRPIPAVDGTPPFQIAGVTSQIGVLAVQCVTGGAAGVAQIQYSLTGGAPFTGPVTVPAPAIVASGATQSTTVLGATGLSLLSDADAVFVQGQTWSSAPNNVQNVILAGVMWLPIPVNRRSYQVLASSALQPVSVWNQNVGLVQPRGDSNSTPVLTLSGTPSGNWQLRVKCTLAGVVGTAKIAVSTDSGATFGADITSSTSPVALGSTGLSGAYAPGATLVTSNLWITPELAISPEELLALRTGAAIEQGFTTSPQPTVTAAHGDIDAKYTAALVDINNSTPPTRQIGTWFEQGLGWNN